MVKTGEMGSLFDLGKCKACPDKVFYVLYPR